MQDSKAILSGKATYLLRHSKLREENILVALLLCCYDRDRKIAACDDRRRKTFQESKEGSRAIGVFNENARPQNYIRSIQFR